MDENKKVCKDFETEKWFLLDGSIPEEKKTIWQDHLSSCEKCSDELDRLKEIVSVYDNLPEEDIDDHLFNKMINAASSHPDTSSQKVFSPIFAKSKSLTETFGFYKLAFGGSILAAALIFIFITFFKNPQMPELDKQIPRELLAWDFPSSSSQLTSIENQILSLETDEWNIYIVRKNNKEDWNNALRTIQNQIRRMKKEAVNASM